MESWEEGYPKAEVFSVQGRRPTMEDTHVVIPNVQEMFPEVGKKIGNIRCSYWGVYDGHGGKEAAEITEKILHKRIIEDPCFAEGKIEDAIKNGIQAADKEILEISDKEKWISGSTVVLAVLWDTKLWVANCGDSEAVIGKRRTNPFIFEDGTSSWHEPFVLSKKHKPNDPDEKERIKKAGGHVVFGRVMGSLAVARAVGDREFKYPFNHGEADFVSSIPWIHTIDITPGQEEFLILSCDGLWDKMTYERAIHFVSRHRHEFQKPLLDTVKLLVQHSIERGSLDNVTATLVYFPAKPVLNTSSSSSNTKSELPEVQDVNPKLVKAQLDSTSSNPDEDDDQEVEVDALQFLTEQYLKKKAANATTTNNNGATTNAMTSSPSQSDLKKDPSKLQQLIQYFQLNPDDDSIIKDYVCSLEKNMMVLYPGILAISKKHLCFFSKFAGTHAIKLDINEIQGIDRQKSFFVTNTIKLTLTTGKKLIFNWRNKSEARDQAFHTLLEVINNAPKKKDSVIATSTSSSDSANTTTTTTTPSATTTNTVVFSRFDD